MSKELNIKCECGAVKGYVHGASSKTTNHAFCYCNDCQAFAHFLNQPNKILDEQGGTDIVQTSSGRLEFTDGNEKLACIRLTPKGMLRWYSACCNTPIGNTPPTSALPFIGLIHNCIHNPQSGSPITDVIGPVRIHGNTSFAKGGNSIPETKAIGIKMLFRFATMIIAARFRGDHKRSPFFNAENRQPTATPRILSSEERATLAAKVAAA